MKNAIPTGRPIVRTAPTTLGREELPVVGGDRRGRGRMWRWLAKVLAAVWILVGLAAWVLSR